ncbi:MAG TPA: Crp/Fnr family transcriptional regulator [Candidatus Saccharimonadales bacterium]|nr:Crp/Fnr family transcriptional regulator [Candidatus Saccharimonadales bacterium]
MPRHSIFFQGDPSNQVFLLVLGSVKSTQITASGSEVILRLSGPGELIGATASGFKGFHRSTVQAMRLSKAIIWDSAIFAALMRRFPVLQHNLIQIVEKQLMDLEERFHEISTANVGGRLSREISRLMTRVGEPANGGVKINLSREELAQMTGTTLFTVSRLLSQWKTKGIVSTGRQFLTVHNTQKLANLYAGE